MNPLRRIERLEKEVAELRAHLPMLEQVRAEFERYERLKSERAEREPEKTKTPDPLPVPEKGE